MCCCSIFTCDMTSLSVFSINLLHTKQILIISNNSFCSAVIIKLLLKCFFVIFLQQPYSFKIAVMNLKTASFPLYKTIFCYIYYQYTPTYKQNHKEHDLGIFSYKKITHYQHHHYNFLKYTQNLHKF